MICSSWSYAGCLKLYDAVRRTSWCGCAGCVLWPCSKWILRSLFCKLRAYSCFLLENRGNIGCLPVVGNLSLFKWNLVDECQSWYNEGYQRWGHFVLSCGFMRLDVLKKFHHIISAYLDVGASGMLLAPRSGSDESSSFVKTYQNWLLRTSAFFSGIFDCVAIFL